MSKETELTNEDVIFTTAIEESDLELMAGYKNFSFKKFDFFVYPKTRPQTFSFQKGCKKYFFYMTKPEIIYIGKEPGEDLKKEISVWALDNFMKITEALERCDMYEEKHNKVYKNEDTMRVEHINESGGYTVSNFEGYRVSVYKRPFGLVGLKKGKIEFFYQMKYPVPVFFRGDRPSDELEKRLLYWLGKYEMNLSWCFGRMDNHKNPVAF
jgi:hypothetical protein